MTIGAAVTALLAGLALQAPAEAATRSGSPALVFASYNVCKTDCAAPAPSWDIRRDRVARTIVESSVDVVGLQEATHWPTSNAKTQFLDIQNLTAPYGFKSPEYTNDSDECRWTAANPRPCTHTTGMLFNTKTVQQMTTPNGTPSAGTMPMSRIAAGLTADAAPRKVVWAYLKGLNGAGPFLALSVHVSTLKDPANEASRIAFGASLDAWVQALNDAHGMSGVPVILMADLNSYRKRQPQGVQTTLTNAGWADAANAPVKRNVQYSTINYNPLLLAEQGFPKKPYKFKTSRRATRRGIKARATAVRGTTRRKWWRRSGPHAAASQSDSDSQRLLRVEALIEPWASAKHDANGILPACWCDARFC
jgi:endonuclease/exonuclease/phosphatase family metal-dependent hydrolase